MTVEYDGLRILENVKSKVAKRSSVVCPFRASSKPPLLNSSWDRDEIR